MRWRCGDFEFVFPRPAVVMGVINVTPDSFSDGGRYSDVEAAVAHGLTLVAEGAEILDVGGESTRPGAVTVSREEEIKRVIPVVERLAKLVNVPISIDTRKGPVAEAALQAGASIVNDVEANRSEPRMWEVVASRRAGYVAMHMQGIPETMQANPTYRDVCGEVADFFATVMARVTAAGVGAEQVIFDPGLGFGKQDPHNLALLSGIGNFSSLGRPVMVGISRKSFIGRLLRVGTAERLPGTLACTQWCASKGVQIFRTHDVAATVQNLRMFEILAAAPA